MSGSSADTLSLRQTAIAAILRQTHFFANISSEDMASVVNCCVTKKLAKGETLFREGQSSEGFYIVQSGAINVYRITPDVLLMTVLLAWDVVDEERQSRQSRPGSARRRPPSKPSNERAVATSWASSRGVCGEATRRCPPEPAPEAIGGGMQRRAQDCPTRSASGPRAAWRETQ